MFPTKKELIRKALYSWNSAPGFEELIRKFLYGWPPDSHSKINLKGKFDNFKIPTLIIEGKWDLLWWDPNRAEVMRKNHPNAMVEIFEKAGHCMFVDQPEMFFYLLQKFFKNLVKPK